MPDVLLTQPHTHGGVLHRAGERLTVDANAAHWLVQLGIAQPAADAPPNAPTGAPKKSASKPDTQPKE